MRTLQEITDAARRNEEVTPRELIYAVCAYDVFLADIDIDQDTRILTKFFIAAEADPKEYIGPENDPFDTKVNEWHKAFINVVPDDTEEHF